MDIKITDYINEGICNECDKDPSKCYNLGYCINDKIIEESENEF